MKKIFLLIAFLISTIISFGQANPFNRTSNTLGSTFEQNIYGTLYNKSFWTSGTFTSDFTNNGTTSSVVSNKISITAPIRGTNTETIDMIAPGYTCLEYWKSFLRFTADTAQTSTTKGLAIGIRSANTFANIGVYAYIDMSSGTNAGKLIIETNYPSNPTILISSTSTLSYSLNDSLEITLERYGVTLTATARNKSTLSALVSATYTFALSYPAATANPPNTGTFSIFALGGRYIVDSVNVFSRETVNADVMCVGDSKTVGFYAAGYLQRWPTIIQNNYKNVVVHAGGGDRTQEVVLRLPEILALKPRQVLLDIGANNLQDSVQFKSDNSTIVNALQAAGIKVYQMCAYQGTGFINLWRWNYLLRTYPAANLIDVYYPLKVKGALVVDSLHPSPYGDSLIANAIFSANKLLSSGSIDPLVSYFINNGLEFINNNTTVQTADYNISGTARIGTSLNIDASGGGSGTKLYSPNASGSFAALYFYPSSSSANVANFPFVIPKGTGQSGIGLFGTDFVADGTNYESSSWQYTGTSFDLYSNKGGSGTLRPLILRAGAAGTNDNQIKLNIDGSTSFLAGKMAIGSNTTIGTTSGLEILSSLPGGSNDRGMQILTYQTAAASSNSIDLYILPHINVSVTQTDKYWLFLDSKLGTGTLTAAEGLTINYQNNHLGAGTRYTGILMGKLTSPAGFWSLYDTTGDPSYIKGKVLVGSNTDNSNGALQVTGDLALESAGNALRIAEGSNGRVGQTTLVSGTKAITITGLTTSSRAFVTLVTPSGVTLTTTYQAVCTANTLTIQANVAAGTINTSDASVLNYFVIN